MRLAFVLPAFLLLSALTVAVPAQQDAAASPSIPTPASALPQQPGETRPAAKPVDAVTRGQARAAERAQKDKDKADAKTKREEEKQRKEAAKDASYLKLQDNEIVAATFDKDGNPVKLAPCARKDKACQTKRKELLKQKKMPFNVQNGTLTVDGWTGKARLNYSVKNFQFVYVSVPGYGTVIASPYHFPGSTEYKDGIDGKTLTVETAEKRIVQIGSDETLVGKQKRPVYFSVDHTYTQPGTFPTVGYGYVKDAPYSWPGTLPLTEDQQKRMAKAPPMPRGMEGREMTLPCQNVAVGDKPKPIKVNGVLVTPPACKVGETPGALAAGKAAIDGSGAASTGVVIDHSKP